MPRSTAHKVLHKRLRLHAYKLQIVQAQEPAHRPRQETFAVNMLNNIDEDIDKDIDYLHRICFTDEVTFQLSGKVNTHNVRIWGENPHMVRDSPKVNIWCGLLWDQVIGSFFFVENTVNTQVYQDMLEQFVFPQLEDDKECSAISHAKLFQDSKALIDGNLKN